MKSEGVHTITSHGFTEIKEAANCQKKGGNKDNTETERTEKIKKMRDKVGANAGLAMVVVVASFVLHYLLPSMVI